LKSTKKEIDGDDDDLALANDNNNVEGIEAETE